MIMSKKNKRLASKVAGTMDLVDLTDKNTSQKRQVIEEQLEKFVGIIYGPKIHFGTIKDVNPKSYDFRFQNKSVANLKYKNTTQILITP